MDIAWGYSECLPFTTELSSLLPISPFGHEFGYMIVRLFILEKQILTPVPAL